VQSTAYIAHTAPQSISQSAPVASVIPTPIDGTFPIQRQTAVSHQGPNSYVASAPQRQLPPPATTTHSMAQSIRDESPPPPPPPAALSPIDFQRQTRKRSHSLSLSASSPQPPSPTRVCIETQSTTASSQRELSSLHSLSHHSTPVPQTLSYAPPLHQSPHYVLHQSTPSELDDMLRRLNEARIYKMQNDEYQRNNNPLI
jgi:hypothetical protein